MITLDSLQSKDVLTRKLCAYFHVPRKYVIAKPIDEGSSIVHFPYLDDRFSFNKIFYCAHLPKLNMLSLFDKDKVESTGILTAWEQMYNQLGDPDVFVYLALYLTGTLWVISSYTAKTPVNSGLIILEHDMFMRPIQNMLSEEEYVYSE
jgi:hypothetical protein